MKFLPTNRSCDPGFAFPEFDRLQREMNRLFNFSFPRLYTGDTVLETGPWSPNLDVYDNKDNIVIKADLPGLSKEDIQVTLHDNVLKISGQKKKDKEIKQEHCLRSERFFGSFQRTLSLPSGLNPDEVKAVFKDGVLELVLPKKEEAKPRQIQIEVK